MYTFPEDEGVFLKFVGDSISQVSLGPYQVHLSFENKANLNAEHKMEQTEPNGTIWGYNCQNLADTAVILHRLLGKRITAIKREDLRLTFAFDDGASLSVLSELGPYESGNIGISGELIIF